MVQQQQLEGVQRLIVCVVGIYVCYLLYGIKQEALAKKGFKDTFFLLFIQCIANALVGYAGYAFNGPSSSAKSLNLPSTKSPFLKILRFFRLSSSHDGHVWLALFSASYILAMGASNYVCVLYSIFWFFIGFYWVNI
jgi:hypothetical protein